MLRLLGYLWAFPWTLVGLLIGALGMLTGGRAQVTHGIVEFWGGGVPWLLERAALIPNVAAMTLGHVVLGCTLADLNRSRAHELVHVRQYERWGPLFVPAYYLCWLVLWWRKLDPYRDNPFEVEAYDRTPHE